MANSAFRFQYVDFRVNTHAGINRESELIGRFPRSLFTGGFADKANGILFGGVVVAPITNPPPMGSGYLPADGKNVASIRNINSTR